MLFKNKSLNNNVRQVRGDLTEACVMRGASAKRVRKVVGLRLLVLRRSGLVGPVWEVTHVYPLERRSRSRPYCLCFFFLFLTLEKKQEPKQA